MLQIFINITRLVLFTERVWAAFALPLVLLFALVASGAFGLWATLPFWVHVPLLVVWLGACAALFYRERDKYPGFPTLEEGRVALERRHLLRHRPLTLAADKPAQTLSPEAQALFEKAQQQAGKEGRKAGPTTLRTQNILTDKWALRYPVMILMLLALWADSDRGFTELQQTFYPAGKQAYLKTIQGVDAWVYPPEYTQEARFALRENTPQTSPQKIPQGSEVKIRLHVVEPLSRQPHLVLVEETFPLKRQGQTYVARADVTKGGQVAVRYRGRELFSAAIELVPDTPPEISLNPPLERTPEGMLNVPFTIKDDYGVKKVEVVLTREDRTVLKELVIPKEGIREAETASYVDFTADPFAGLTVNIQLKATDMAGQKTLTPKQELMLPERPFNHPVAKRLVALRKELFQTPDKAGYVAGQLRGIMSKPEDFDHNSRAYMSITFAEQTLRAQSESHISRAMGLMWDAALHIEKGPIAMQMERMLNAQRELQQALAEGASPEELDALFRKFAQAMSDLLRQAQFGGDVGEMMDVPSLQNSDLAALMEKINELLKSGAYAEAQKLLKELEKLMAHVSMGDNQALKEFQEGMSDLQNIKKQQEQLIEEAFENDIPGRLTAEQQLRQQMLASKLSQTAQKLKGLGMDVSKLEDAARAMQGAHKVSQQPGMEAFVNHLQNQALKLMSQGQQQIAAQLRQMMGYGGMAGMRRDPSGKLQPMGDGEAVLPDEAPETLSRQIRDMLFDRAGQLKGSDVEHQYLKRLLEQF